MRRRCLTGTPIFYARMNGCGKRTVYCARRGKYQKGGSVLRGSKAVRFQFIASYRGSLSRSHLCRMMGVTDRGLRVAAQAPVHPSAARHGDPGAYPPTASAEPGQLRQAADDRGAERAGPAGRTASGRPSDAPERHPHHPPRAAFKRTTDSDHAFNIAPNLLQQDFSASAPNQKWAGYITSIWTREGWVYLAVIMTCSRGA
jgi:putative transposase